MGKSPRQPPNPARRLSKEEAREQFEKKGQRPPPERKGPDMRFAVVLPEETARAVDAWAFQQGNIPMPDAVSRLVAIAFKSLNWSPPPPEE